ncbi:MAG: DUF4340 domain-containing protein [Lentisphaerae bacterium]|nr:DUF4340 domain-containing protein [Lentisphaerota bacterium]
MTFRTTGRLLAAVCVTAAAVWLVKAHVRSTDERTQRRRRLMTDSLETVNHLLIERGGMQAVCRREPGGWMMERPVRARAADAAIERILSVLESAVRQEVITGVQRRERRLTLRDYGLTEPRARLVLNGAQGRDELLVGGDAPVGDAVYVKLAGHDEVCSVARDILDAVPETLEALRDRLVLRGDPLRTRRVDLQRPETGFIQLTYRDGRWWIDQPVTARAEDAAVTALLQALYGLRVRSFVWDAPVDEGGTAGSEDPGRLEPYGLAPDEARARATVWMRNGEGPGRTLIVGKRAGEAGDTVYAKRRDFDSIVTVSSDILDVLDVSVNALLSRDLFAAPPEAVDEVCFERDDRKLVLRRAPDTGWKIEEPVQWAADDRVVNTVLARLRRLRAADIMAGTAETVAARAAWRVRLGAGKPALLVGPHTNGQTAVWARFENGDGPVYMLDANQVAASGISTDPLDFRDRSFLSVKPENVRGLTVWRPAGEQSVVRNEAGDWMPAEGATGRVDRASVEAVLLTVADLRALRSAGRLDDVKAACGLDAPSAALTLDLSGEAGIRKTVLFGSAAGPGEVYAVIQGQDVVFVLDAARTRLLTAAVLRADGAGGTPAP